MSYELLTKKSDGWYKGCGCGMKAADKVVPPDSTVELYIQHDGVLVGPVSGIKYRILPHTTTIDVDPADARQWRTEGVARDPIQGYKGRLSRLD